MKTTVTWQDLGSPTEPGLYEFDDGVLYVKQRELMSGRSTRTRYSRYRPFGRTSAQFDMCWAPMSCRGELVAATGDPAVMAAVILELVHKFRWKVIPEEQPTR